MAKRADAKVVWSSSDDDPGKARDPGAVGGSQACESASRDGRRAAKAVTAAFGVPLDDAWLRVLAG